MHFILLGTDSRAMPLVRAIESHAGHRLTRPDSVTGDRAEIAGQHFRSSAPGNIKALNPQEEIDAAIVAGSDTDVVAAAKSYAAAGTSLLVIPEVVEDFALIHELTLIVETSSAQLHPLFLLRALPEVKRLRGIIDRDLLGDILDIQMERTIALDPRQSSTDASPTVLPLRDVNRALISDVDLLRFFAGDFDQVTCQFSGKTETGVIRRLVTLAGDHVPESTWSLHLTTVESTWQLIVTGHRATAVLSGTDFNVNLEVRGDLVEQEPTLPPSGEFDWGSAILKQLETAPPGHADFGNWVDATRAFEILEAAHRSVARRRTIDLHHETTSERSVFKTQMTALGCGLLMFTPVAVLGVLLLGALFDPDEMSERSTLMLNIARIAVFSPLLLFLVLQLLIFVAKPSTKRTESSDS